MKRRLDVQVIGGGEALAGELRAALEGLDGVQARVSSEPELQRGVEAVRDRSPELAVIDVDRDPLAVRVAAEELHRTAPGTLMVAAYRSEAGDALEQRDEWIGLMRAGVRDFLRRPVSAGELDEVLGRQVLGARTGSATGRVVSFVGNKGGVGKSTLAINVATLLARRNPGRVLLLDASLQLGVCAAMLDLEPEATLADAARELYRLDETLLRNLVTDHESGLDLLAAPRDAAEAAAIDDAALGRALAVARRTYDWVIVDSFPLLDGIAMTSLDLSDRVWVVTTASVPTVRGTAAFLRVLERLGVPSERVRLALNGTQPRFAGSLGARDVESRLECPVEVVIPFSKGFLAAADLGQPYGLAAGRWSRVSRALRTIVDDLESLPVRGAAAAEVRS